VAKFFQAITGDVVIGIELHFNIYGWTFLKHFTKLSSFSHHQWKLCRHSAELAWPMGNIS
jgi:hypothetical protein